MGNNLQSRSHGDQRQASAVQVPEAIRSGDIKVINEYLLDPEHTLTPSLAEVCFQSAVKYGDLETVNLLVERGFDPNQKLNDSGDIGLHVSTFMGDPAMLCCLLENGASVNTKNLYGETPVHIAAEKGHDQIMRMLLEHEGMHCINDVSKRRQRRADLRTHVHVTALQAAAKQWHVKCVEMLVQHGAKLGKTADLCTFLSNKDDDAGLMELLIDTGLGIHAHRGSLRQTLLHEAAMKGNPNIVALLLERGAKVNAVDRQRQTPLHLATDQNHLLVIERLLVGGSNVNLLDRRRQGALHLSARRGDIRVIDALLKHGAPLETTNKSGRLMPHHICTLNCHEMSLHLMLMHDCPIDATSEMGSALEIAQGIQNNWPHGITACMLLLFSHGACDDKLLSDLARVWVCGRDYSWLPAMFKLVSYSGNENGFLREKIDAIQAWLFAVGQDYYDWLTDYRSSPPTLKISCRIVTRRHLRAIYRGKSIWKRIDQTALPRSLRDYLKLRDLYDVTRVEPCRPFKYQMQH